MILINIPYIVSKISATLWGWPMIVLLIGTHIFLTVRLKFPQRKIFKAIKMSVTKDSSAFTPSAAGGGFIALLPSFGSTCLRDTPLPME